MANSNQDFIKHSFLCGVRGFHVYKEIWKPIVGELLMVHLKVTDENYRRSPLIQGGLEIPVEVI